MALIRRPVLRRCTIVRSVSTQETVTPHDTRVYRRTVQLKELTNNYALNDTVSAQGWCTCGPAVGMRSRGLGQRKRMHVVQWRTVPQI